MVKLTTKIVKSTDLWSKINLCTKSLILRKNNDIGVTNKYYVDILSRVFEGILDPFWGYLRISVLFAFASFIQHRKHMHPPLKFEIDLVNQRPCRTSRNIWSTIPYWRCCGLFH
jgi:hypothetical protein